MTSEKKLCPILSTRLLDSECKGEKCALYVKLVKFTPSQDLVYRGCGLIHHIPWETKEGKQP